MAEEITTTSLVCGECARADRGYFEPEFEGHEDGSSVHRCPECGVVVMVHLAMGELDLGIIRDSQVTDVEDRFWYGEP